MYYLASLKTPEFAQRNLTGLRDAARCHIRQVRNVRQRYCTWDQASFVRPPSIIARSEDLIRGYGCTPYSASQCDASSEYFMARDRTLTSYAATFYSNLSNPDSMAENTEATPPTTIPLNGKHDVSLSSERQPWLHWSLRRSTFISFAATLVVLIITLGILNLYSNRNNGICTAGERQHYVWTYLPTAVFTLLAAVWSNTDYRAKQMQPWACKINDGQNIS